MMDRRLSDPVLFRSDIPACSCSRTAARSPTAASKATSLHNRCAWLQELRVCEGDLEGESEKRHNMIKHRTKTAASFTIVQKIEICETLPVGGDTGESLAADGVTICCGCADATVPFVCVPFVCEDCCGV